MTDSEPLYTEEVEDSPDEGRDSPVEGGPRQANRRLIVTVLAAAAIFIIVLFLLTLRGCGSLLNLAERRGSTNQIVPVEGSKPVDGSISMWVAAGTDVEAALTRAQVNHLGIVDMGGGRFVVRVPTGAEVVAVRMLRGVEGVYDAGRVYADETTVTP